MPDIISTNNLDTPAHPQHHHLHRPDTHHNPHRQTQHSRGPTQRPAPPPPKCASLRPTSCSAPTPAIP
ncbi:hypothetical protein B0T18DRAFT_419409 [Schizothecium vesticola]|uniref:Uncharacterized protein n=1 Tax=Schizothecium vesticola TaxID=314040 RepID=A0AA40EKN4_9PEZI|nr:hypothetical protein B0T18DRAFT_419409 [Schizothecium vesticola]